MGKPDDARRLRAGAPAERSGCDSQTADPELADKIAERFVDVSFKSRAVAIGASEDEHKTCFELDWTNGLRVAPRRRCA